MEKTILQQQETIIQLERKIVEAVEEQNNENISNDQVSIMEIPVADSNSERVEPKHDTADHHVQTRTDKQLAKKEGNALLTTTTAEERRRRTQQKNGTDFGVKGI